MVGLVLVPQPPDDLDRLGHAGGLDDDRLEPPFERPVLLDVLAVLVERGGADRLDLAAREGRLQHVRGVDRALGGAGADQRVELVEEEHDVLGLADLLHDRLEPLLELPAVLRSGHQRAQVELEQPLVHEHVGHVMGNDLLGEPLDDGRLPHPRLADQDRVILGAPGEDLDHALNLGFAPDHGIELQLPGELREVPGELVEHGGLRALLGPRVVLVAQQRQRLLADLVEAGAERLEDLRRDRLAFLHQPEEQVLGADVVVAKLAGLLDRELEDALGLRGERDLAERQRLGEPGERPLDLRLDRLQAEPEPLEHRRRDALAVPDEPEEDVLGADEVVPEPARLLTCQDDDPPRSLGEPFKHSMALAGYLPLAEHFLFPGQLVTRPPV